MIRIAPHPPDPHRALKDQVEMISDIKDQDFTVRLFHDLVEKLQDAPFTII
jgi:hypothetical protein